MENWRAGLLGVGIVLIGFGGYASLEGAWKGLSLVGAGIALVLLGLSLDRRPRAARARPEPSAQAEAADVDVGVSAALERAGASGEDVTEPIARGEPEAVPAVEPVEAPAHAVVEPEPAAEPEPEPEAAQPVPSAQAQPASAGSLVGSDGAAQEDDEHRHDQPMLGHSELVSHIRDYHEGVPFDGSTIQLRLLHERAHA